MKTIFILLLFLVFSTATAQSEPINKPDTTYAYIPEIHQSQKYGYSVEVPEWLDILTNDGISFGGKLPEIKGIANAILITGFNKNEFKNFKDFQRIYITGNIFGQPALFNESHTWYGRNERDFKKIKNGVSSRVFIRYKGLIYHHQFVLIETKKAYLLINFCATPETYDENLPKFDEFLSGLRIN